MIFTFYSFKGGVGRSMAVANIAELLYRRGLRVIMVDFDLEAPGLERFFDLPGISDSRGIIDMISSYRNLSSLPNPGPLIDRKSRLLDQESSLPLFVEPISNFIVPIHQNNAEEKFLSLIPAGRRSGEEIAHYAEKLRSINWNDLYANRDGERFFNWCRV